MTLKDKIVATTVAALTQNKMCLTSFGGPLGGHRNYLTHIALPKVRSANTSTSFTKPCDSGTAMTTIPVQPNAPIY